MRTLASFKEEILKIDTHAHFFPTIGKEEAESFMFTKAPWLNINGANSGMMMDGDTEYRFVQSPLWNPADRLKEMDENEIDVQIISPTPLLFSYTSDSKNVARWSARINDFGAASCETNPQRLYSLCQVPLQDVDQACIEVSRSMAAGHVGVHLGTHVNGRNFDDPEMIRFLHYCATEGIPILIHPWDMMAPERMPKYMLQWLVGMPAETHLSILSLILSGAFERLPTDLKVCFAHGGGSFAMLLGRLDNAWHRHELVRQDCPRPPSEYVERFSVDSAVFDDKTLRFLLDVMGDTRVMMGSDYPFPLGEIHPGEMIKNSELIDDATKQTVLYDNAANFFGITND